MTQDFTKHIKIINEFRGKVLRNDFENNFAKLTENINKNERFLLKMELKRLAQPCIRLIDLRGLVDGECYVYEHDNRQHFLDNLAIKVFEENIKAYGSYTFGVYEAVTNTDNNFRVIYQREKSQEVPLDDASTSKVLEKTQYPATSYSFGPYHIRAEERMNYAISLDVTFNGTEKHTCTTTDISENGCRFRLAKTKTLHVGDTINIRFKGLEQEFQFPHDDGYQYVIKNIETIEKNLLIGTRKVDEQGKPDSFQLFLKGYIQSNKRRYKINLDNAVSALNSRIYEQYLLPKINELPIFIASKNNVVTPKYCLTCQNNRVVYEYWQTEKQTSTLHYLITEQRLKKLFELQITGHALWVYSFFVEVKGQKIFYTADNMQLEGDQELAEKFLGFAASKNTFSITKLSLQPIDKSKAISPYTIANTVINEYTALNSTVSDEIFTILNGLNFIVVANDVTEPTIVREYQALPFEGITSDKIKQFGHKRTKQDVETEPLGINYNDHRKEGRFFYKTPVTITINKATYAGKTMDFSVSGLQIQLSKSAPLKKGDIVYLSLPELQKITAAFNLEELAYVVIRSNKYNTIFNLKVKVEQYKHVGRSFFKVLIEKNKHKLKASEYGLLSPELGKVLRNIYSQTMSSNGLIAQISGSRYKFDVVTANQTSPFLSLLSQLSDRKNYVNLYPLLNNLAMTDAISQYLKKSNEHDTPFSKVLYIAYDKSQSHVEKAIKTMFDDELNTKELKAFFIKQALKKGQFFCIQLSVSRSGKADIKHLNPELSYIGTYAIHRGKQLEQEIESVTGVIQFFDITQEAMIRYRLS